MTDKTVPLYLLEAIIKDLRDDALEMDKVNPDGRVHGFASRFIGYAAALEGHSMKARMPIQMEIEAMKRESNPDGDDDYVPEQPGDQDEANLKE